MKYSIFSALLLCCFIWSCDQENFDLTASETEDFDPIVTELPPYKWAVGIDTIPIPIDSSWFAGVLGDDLGVIAGGSNVGPPSAPTSAYVVFSMEFSVPGGYPFSVGNYELLKFTQQQFQFNNSTNVWDTLINRTWAGSQIDGTIEFSTTEEFFEPMYNAFVWEHTGFASGVLTNDDGTTHDLNSAFHRLR
ncbi:MAG: hypothetical protein AAFO02_07055 [Bacteroidota bacterium]